MRILIIAVSFLAGCAASKSATTTIPICIQQRIDSLKRQPKQNPAASIEEYRYNGRKVYLYSAPCCDQYNVLVDENCNQLCAPSGGFTGKGDGKCADFKTQATFIKVVWKDER